MSWFSRAQPQIPAQPQASERDRIRAQQVESLVRANPHAQARNPEKSVFELGLKLADGQIARDHFTASKSEMGRLIEQTYFPVIDTED